MRFNYITRCYFLISIYGFIVRSGSSRYRWMASDAIPAYRDETINCLVRRRAGVALDEAGRETKKDKVPVYLMVVNRENWYWYSSVYGEYSLESVLGYQWWGTMQVLALGSLTPSLQSLRLAYIYVFLYVPYAPPPRFRVVHS